MQRPAAMNSIKDSKKLIRKALRNIPDLPFEIPFLARRSSIVPYVLGAIGVALVGAVAAVMVFSPRTRYRALGVAKNTYGKMQDQLHSMGVNVGMNRTGANNIGTGSDYSSSTGM